MANSFSKQDIVMFEDVVDGFYDQLVLIDTVSSFSTNQTLMARSGDVINRPVEYIAQSNSSGLDQTGNFKNYTQLTVPATISNFANASFVMDGMELRDMLQETRLMNAARKKLESDINKAIMNVVCNQSTLVVKRTTAAAGFDDVAQCESIFNENGIDYGDRFLAMSTRDYNGMANNLSALSRSFGNTKTDTAYEKAYVGRVASFETIKLDYANRIAAAGGTGLTIDTRAAGANYYTPVATRTASTGERSNVDNRYQVITISSTTSVVAGDCFTIAAVNSVHHITKTDTGQLKTFRVISVPSSTTLQISPPIISGQGLTDAELQYQNCVVNTTASTSAIVFLNTTAAPINPFWKKDAIEIIPGRMNPSGDSGMLVIHAAAKAGKGLDFVFSKQTSVFNHKTYYRIDCLFGIVNKQPEHTGIILFGQS